MKHKESSSDLLSFKFYCSLLVRGISRLAIFGDRGFTAWYFIYRQSSCTFDPYIHQKPAKMEAWRRRQIIILKNGNRPELPAGHSWGLFCFLQHCWITCQHEYKRLAAFSITIHCSWHQTEFRFVCLCTFHCLWKLRTAIELLAQKKRKTIQNQ